MDFFDKIGIMAIGSRLRMLTDMITEDASQIYQLYGMDFKAKWFPVFFLLSDGKPRTITGIAEEIGHSHPSVSTIIREMSAKGLVQESKDKADGRRNMVKLSRKGKEDITPMHITLADVKTAVEAISKESKHNLWKAIEEWEYLLAEKSLLQRVKEEKRNRESQDIAIVPYKASYQSIFRALNEEWITTYWEMEDADYKALDHPQEYILDKGGYIFVALYKNEPVGVCALYKMDDPVYDYELAKYAVSPKAQGKGIGVLLCKTVIDKAIELRAKRIFLESNTILKPAIRIYRKLGFKELAEYHTAYERGDIQMELILNNKAIK